MNSRLFNSIFDVYKKNYYSYQKMFNMKFLQLFENNNFYNILSHAIKFGEKIEFLIFDACFKTKHELDITGLRMKWFQFEKCKKAAGCLFLLGSFHLFLWYTFRTFVLTILTFTWAWLSRIFLTIRPLAHAPQRTDLLFLKCVQYKPSEINLK